MNMEQHIEFMKLVAKVSALNKETGDILFLEIPSQTKFIPDGDLSCCFLWADTRQGDSYWRAFWEALDDLDGLEVCINDLEVLIND